MLTGHTRRTSVTLRGQAKAERDKQVRAVATAVTLFSLWLLMSGIYKPMIIGFGATAAIVAVYVSRRMDQVDGDKISLILNPLKSLGYLCWLLVEIAKSNLAVTRVILSGIMPIRQNIFRVPSRQRSDLGQVIFANSITLTPGTITVETEDDHFWVHALAFAQEDHAALADMGARVAAVETGDGS